MDFRTRKDGKVYRHSKYNSTKSHGKINPPTKQSETKILRHELRIERQKLVKLKKEKIKLEKQRLKNQAIKQTLARIRRDQSLLTAISTNRISPQRVDQILHKKKNFEGSNYRAIPGLGI